MMRSIVFAVLLTVSCGAVWAAEKIETPTHRFEEIAEGVYHAVGTGSIYVMSNSLVLIGESDVLVVDSHVTPAAARALLKAIETLSDKPVRYLVNSHYHFDHAHGNQVFTDGVEIIGHTYTREKLSGNVLEEDTFLSFAKAAPEEIARLKDLIADEDDANRIKALEKTLLIQEDYLLATAEVVPTPPNITLDESLTLYQGDREIRLLYFGRGHTGGDVVVFLPKERVVFTGDLMLPFLSYMGDGFVDEWDETLEGLKALDFDVMLPGHGPPIRGKERIGYFQAYLRDFWTRVSELKALELSAEQAAERVDMTDHRGHYPQIAGPGADVRAVRRIYQRLDE